MSFYATDEMKALKSIFSAHYSTFKPSEFYIVEGSASGNGYHHSREDLIRRGKTGAYSIQHSLDKKGDPKAAAAFDLLFKSDKELHLATKRLNDAARAKDSRVYMKVREFGGTLDGKKVTAYNVTEQRSISFDSSHLWHLHVSVHRAYTKDSAVLKGIAEAICGVKPGSGGGGTVPEPAKEPFKKGDKLEVTVDVLNARYEANGAIKTTVTKGYKVTVTEQKLAGGQWWVKGATYWYAAQYLKKAAASTPAPKPEPKVVNKYIVNTDVLNVRSSGSTVDSKNIVGAAKRGQKVSGYEVTTGGRVWVVDSKNTYFAQQYLVKYVTYVVTANELNVRASASTSGKILKTVKKGAYVLVVSTSGSWAKDVDGNFYSTDYLKKA